MAKAEKPAEKPAKKPENGKKKVDKKKEELVNKRLGKVKEFAVKIRDKFGKYIKSVIAFEAVERPGITEDSPIEVLVVADDTAVRKQEMGPGFRDNLVSKIRSMGEEVDPKLRIEVNMLTQFWDFARRGDPTFYTYIRTGVPVLDLGFFEPLKRLLYMGAIRPTQEAILRSMEASKDYLKKVETYWEWSIERMYRAVTWSCNAFLMSNGMPPADPKEMAAVLEHYFVEPGKIEAKYPQILGKIVKTYKDIEHGVYGEIKGDVVKELGSGTRDFVEEMNNRVKDIMGNVEKTGITKEKVKTTPKIFWVYETGSRGYAWLFEDSIFFAVYEEGKDRVPKLAAVMKSKVMEKELGNFEEVKNEDLYSKLETSDFKPIITPSLITIVLNHLPEKFRNNIAQVGVEYPGKALLDLSEAMMAKKGS
jgi:uncharacterized protein (UPF0332 family)